MASQCVPTWTDRNLFAHIGRSPARGAKRANCEAEKAVLASALRNTGYGSFKVVQKSVSSSFNGHKGKVSLLLPPPPRAVSSVPSLSPFPANTRVAEFVRLGAP